MTPATFVALNGVANTGALVASAQLNGDFVQFATVQATFSDAAATGSLRLEQSNDPANPPASTSWTPIAASAVAVTAGGTQMTPPVQLCSKWYRVGFARTAGAGTITARVHSQGDAS